MPSKTLPRKTREELSSSRASVEAFVGHSQGEISGGRLDLTLAEPGIYRGMLSEIVLVRTSDKVELKVPFYSIDFEIAEHDLKAGRYNIDMSDQLSRISVVDQSGQRVAERLKISIQPVTEGHTEMYFELETDGSGIIFWGNPSKYTMRINAKPWLRVRAEALP